MFRDYHQRCDDTDTDRPSAIGARRVGPSSALYGVCCPGQRDRVDARTVHADVHGEQFPLVWFRAVSDSDCLVDSAWLLGLQGNTANSDIVIRIGAVFARWWSPIAHHCPARMVSFGWSVQVVGFSAI